MASTTYMLLVQILKSVEKTVKVIVILFHAFQLMIIVDGLARVPHFGDVIQMVIVLVHQGKTSVTQIFAD